MGQAKVEGTSEFNKPKIDPGTYQILRKEAAMTSVTERVMKVTTSGRRAENRTRDLPHTNLPC